MLFGKPLYVLSQQKKAKEAMGDKMVRFHSIIFYASLATILTTFSITDISLMTQITQSLKEMHTKKITSYWPAVTSILCYGHQKKDIQQ